jgi:hypothetical protein
MRKLANLTTSITAAFIGLGLIGMGGPLHAQGLPPIVMPMPSGMNVGDAHAVLWDTPSQQRRPQPQQKQSQQQASAFQGQAGTLTFVTSPTRRQENLRAFVQLIAASDRAGALQAQSAFSRVDPITQMDAPIRRQFGASTNNIVDAYTIFLLSTWTSYNDYQPDISRSQFDAVKGQLTRGSLQLALLSRFNDAQKQEAADRLLLKAFFVAGAEENAKSNPSIDAANDPQIIEMVRHETGIDITTLDLTNTGFVTRPRRGN